MVAWLSGAFYAIFHTINTFSLQFCGPNVIDHFFCDSSPIMRLSCSDSHTNEEIGFVVGGCTILGAFALTIISYVLIIATIARTQSAGGRWKAFSTCSSHITVVVLFFASAFIVYVGPPESLPEGTDKLLALVYTFLTPFLNPIIYTFRNKEVREAVRRVTQSIRAMMKRP